MPSDPAPTYTPFLNLAKPPDDADNWGGDYRAAMDSIDLFASTTAAGQAAQQAEFEWTVVAGEAVPRYIGISTPGIATTALGWTIKRFTWATGATGEAVLVSIDVAEGAWDGRSGLFA